MSIGNKLKELRLSKGLTQEAFARKFFVKENTISNYEKGVRTPSVEFLSQVCKEFGLTLDYFEEKESIASNPQDLVVTKKYNKCAIFDTKQSCYLTPHIYQYICLSDYGYHLVFNRNSQGHITYSAMLDNFGNVTEFDGMALGNNGTFDKFGNIVAYNKKLNGVVLMNYKGEILSKTYNRIQKINTIQHTKEDCDYGLYFGLATNNDNELCVKDLLDVNGKIIDLKINQNNFFEYEIEDFNNVDNVFEAIKQFGIGMIYFIPDKMFENEEIYTNLCDYSCKQILLSTKENCFDYLLKFYEIIELLTNKQKIYKIKLNFNINKIEILSSLDNKIENKIILNQIKRKLEDLLNELIN